MTKFCALVYSELLKSLCVFPECEEAAATEPEAQEGDAEPASGL